MNEKHVAITMFPEYIKWEIAIDGEVVLRGSDPLTSTNGDYNSLLSNVVNHCVNSSSNKNLHFWFSRG